MKTAKVCYEGKMVTANKELFEKSLVEQAEWNYLGLVEGEEFYMVKTLSGIGGTYSMVEFDNSSLDKKILTDCTCYKTKEECERYIEINNALESKAMKFWEINWDERNQKRYSLYLNVIEKTININYNSNTYSGAKYIFKDEELAIYFIDKYTYEEFAKYVFCINGMYYVEE